MPTASVLPAADGGERRCGHRRRDAPPSTPGSPRDLGEQDRRRQRDAQARVAPGVAATPAHAAQAHQHHDKQVEDDDPAGVNEHLDHGKELRPEQ